MATRRRMEFELVGTERGIEAILNRITAGINRVGQGSRQTNRELGLVDKQLMAIGTTARYALAGGFVFGVTGAIGRLADLNNQLAQTAALAGRVGAGGYQGPSQNLLGDIGSQAIIESNKLGLAVNDIQSYMNRFYSAFDVRRGQGSLDEMRGYVEEVGRLQASLGEEAGDPQMLAGGIAGLVNQIPGGRQHIGRTTNRVSNLIYSLLAATPNITGRDVARDIGRVGATMSIANMTPEQAFAVWAQAGRAGGSASVIGRGVSQLLGTSLLHPSTPAQITAFQQAGLPTDPTTLRSMGGFNVLLQMMRAVAPRGARVRNRGILGNEEVDDDTALSGAGIQGVNLTLLYNLLGRQESVRQFVNLLSSDGVRGLQNFTRGLDTAVKQNQAGQREEAAQRQRAIQRLNTSLGNIPLSLLRGPINAVAAPLATGAEHVGTFLASHRTTTNAVEGVLGAALGVAGARRLWRNFRSLRGGSALRDAAGAAITAEEMPNLVSPVARPDGTRANPLWVMISPASWMVGTPGGDPSRRPIIPGTNDNAPTSLFNRVKGWGGWAAGAASIFGRSGVRAALGGLGAASAELPALPDMIDTLLGNDPFGYNRYDRYPHLKEVHDNRHATRAQNAILTAVQGDQWGRGRMIGAPRAEALLRLLETARGQGVAGAVVTHPNGSMDVTVRLVDAQGRTIATQKKGGVPVKWFPQTGAPSAQGKHGAKGSH